MTWYNLFEVADVWWRRFPHIAAARQCGANKLRPFQGRRQAAPRCKMQFAIAQLQVAAGYSLRGCRPMQDAICNCAIASCSSRHVKWGVVPSSIVTSLNRLICNVLSLLTVELDTWALSRLPRQVKNGGLPPAGEGLGAYACICTIATGDWRGHDLEKVATC